ncbi:hypothetical protein A5819_003147 [Enterococcus sp. 7E2_DIV0204]|nr:MULTISPECIES: CD1375 family protein [unclassified Enterococcus]OTN86313.1 hypothetical protein A5819_003147 [Enterococcus sp. 7E2_DIV0204]OTP48494.1 hypothetical protein A5884_003157 [Enterococcus sp. 7D2_DIV0200]
MIKLYADLIEKNVKSIEDVPKDLQKKVKAELKKRG